MNKEHHIEVMVKSIKPFGSVKSCPKCGGVDYSIKHIGSLHDYGEHLVIKCLCSFSWLEQTKDHGL